MFSNLYSGFRGWYNSPYDQNMNVPRWFLFIGLYLLILATWKILLTHFMEA